MGRGVNAVMVSMVGVVLVDVVLEGVLLLGIDMGMDVAVMVTGTTVAVVAVSIGGGVDMVVVSVDGQSWCGRSRG